MSVRVLSAATGLLSLRSGSTACWLWATRLWARLLVGFSLWLLGSGSSARWLLGSGLLGLGLVCSSACRLWACRLWASTHQNFASAPPLRSVPALSRTLAAPDMSKTVSRARTQQRYVAKVQRCRNGSNASETRTRIETSSSTMSASQHCEAMAAGMGLHMVCYIGMAKT